VPASRLPLQPLTQIHNRYFCYHSVKAAHLAPPYLAHSSPAESQCSSSSYSLPMLGEHAHSYRHPNKKNTYNATCMHVLSVDAAATILETQTTSSSAITPISSPSPPPPPPLSARQGQGRYVDGNSNPQKSSAPSSGCMHSPFNIHDAGGGSTPTTPFPFLALIIGSLALLWMWAKDEAMILRPRLRLRSGALDKTAMAPMGRGKGGCRCRVCMLRTQACSQPLHDVKDNMA
jgi:hypothetical protein